MPRVPVIGITACTSMIGLHATQTISEKYARAAAKAACGLPIVIPSLGELMDSADILDVVDGLIFTGSPSNIEPFHYNGAASAAGTHHDPLRDATTLPLMRAAIAAGRRAVIIEGGPYGTTCARVGCMPSKLLIAAAEAAHVTEKWDAFGIRLEGTVRIDGRAVMERVRRERDRFVGFVVRGVDSIPAEHKLRGYAKFIDDRSLQVDEHTVVTFGRAVIATGSSPAVPAMLEPA